MENKSYHDKAHTPDSNNVGEFYCPMHCEGDKTYDKPGSCPVCNMHLVFDGGENDKPDQYKHHTHTNDVQHQGAAKNNSSQYYCPPMHCEGDKMYEKPGGDCPVCGMHLIKEESASKPKTIYTCPMHPEIKQQGPPGSCPKCGMDLVPKKGGK